MHERQIVGMNVKCIYIYSHQLVSDLLRTAPKNSPTEKKSYACIYLHSLAIRDIMQSERMVTIMANTTAVYARIDTVLKESAESILSQLGISPSSAIQMLYSQIVLQQGMPFDLKLSVEKPTAVGGMTRTELNIELAKGINSLQNGRTYSADEVDAVLAKEFGI